MQLIRDREGGERWSRIEIPEAGLALWRNCSGDVEIASVPEPQADAWILPFNEGDGLRQAALVLSPRARSLFVGGRRPVEVSILEERCELVLGGTRLYFTARRPLVVERHAQDAVCGVCGEGVKDCEAIACTQCRAVAHEGAMANGEERLCFSFRGGCPGCQLRREDFEWSPEVSDA